MADNALWVEAKTRDGSVVVPIKLVLLHDDDDDNDRSTLVLLNDDQRVAMNTATMRERQRILNGVWYEQPFWRIIIIVCGGGGLGSFLLQIYSTVHRP